MKLSVPPYMSRLALPLALICLTGCGSGVSGFDWAVEPDRRTVAPGGQALFTITISQKTDINANVALRVTGAPTGATVNLSPQTLPGTSTTSMLTVQVPAGTTVGTYTLSVFAQEAGQTEQQKDVLLIVSSGSGQADFSLEVDPAEFTFTNIEAGKTFTYFVRPLNNFQGTVTTTVTGLSDDLVMSQPPTPSQVTIGPTGGAGGTYVIRVQPHPPVTSPVTLTVTSTSGAITHVREVTIIIPN